MICYELIEFLKEERKRQGLSMAKVAKRCGMMRQNIEKLEKRKRIPRIDTLTKVLDALGYELEVKKIKE